MQEIKKKNLKNKGKDLSLALIIIILVKACKSFYIPTEKNFNKTLSNFSFGSCFLGFLSERDDMFKTINENNPDLWIWLGDAAYIDRINLNYFASSIPLDVEYAQQMFNKVKNDKYYSLLEKSVPTLGVWDDHDYGFNDANGNFLEKHIAKKLYLDFIGEPEDSKRRDDSIGIYATYSFGDLNSFKTFRIILLDVRYNKTSFFSNHPDMLGEDQWIWFENTIKSANETFIFIGSGTQILPFDKLLTEAWYGESRKRLFDLIIKYEKSGIIFLTGDIHCAEILKTFCTLPEIGYDIIEITSSGLSHYCGFKIFQDHLFSNNYNTGEFINDFNFAFIEFEWGKSKKESKLIVKVKNIQNEEKIKRIIEYKSLKYDSSLLTKGKNSECYDKINSRFKSFREYFEYYTKTPLKLVPILFMLLLILLIFYGFYFLVRKIIRLFQNALGNIYRRIWKKSKLN